MRSHDVPSFPDPNPGGGVFTQQIIRAGINPQSPAFQSAMSACQRIAPGGKAAYGPTPGARKVELVMLAECMHKHGLSTFPDPTTSAPSSVGGVSLGDSGEYLSVPESLIQAPAFRQAATACGFPVPGGPKRVAIG